MLKSLVFILAAVIAAVLFLDRKAYSAADKSALKPFSRPQTDALRGIAIILVITGHIGTAMGCQPVGTFGSFGVALFLFLSGYGLNESFRKNGLKNYWPKKLKRVWLPYAIVISTLGLYVYDLSLGDYLLNVTGIHTEYWFVAFLIKWYVAYWVLTKFFPQWRLVLLTALGIIAIFTLGYLPGEQAFCFTAGVAASAYYDKLSALDRRSVTKIAFAALALCAIIWSVKQATDMSGHFEQGCWQLNMVKSFIKITGCIGMVAAAQLLTALSFNRFLIFMGTLSFELYLLHYPFYEMLDGSVAKAALMVGGSIVGAVVLNRVLKKIESGISALSISAR